MNGTTEVGTLVLAPGRADARPCAPGIDCDTFIRNVYDEHGPVLLRYAARLLDGDWHKAEDILQETAARAWKHAAYLTGHHQHVRPWLFTVTKNLVLDHHRARQVRPLELRPVEELDASLESTDSDSADTVLSLHLVLDALQDLNDQQQTVIRLMYPMILLRALRHALESRPAGWTRAVGMLMANGVVRELASDRG